MPADPRAMCDLVRSVEVLRWRVELSASCCIASPLELADGRRDSVCSPIARGGEVMVNAEYSRSASLDPTIVPAVRLQPVPSMEMFVGLGDSDAARAGRQRRSRRFAFE